MLAFLNPKVALNIPAGWIFGAIAFAGTLTVASVKLLLWNNNKKNGEKFVYKDVCEKQHEVEKTQHKAVQGQLKTLNGKVDQVLTALLNK